MGLRRYAYGPETTSVRGLSMGSGVPCPLTAIVYALARPRRLAALKMTTATQAPAADGNSGTPARLPASATHGGNTNRKSPQKTMIWPTVLRRFQLASAGRARRKRI